MKRPASPPPTSPDHPHEFRYTPPADHRPATVHVAGEFNGWSASATALHDDGLGVFRATVLLSEGLHLYKFVLDGQRWINDPAADKTLDQPDGLGGSNSGLLIGPDARRLAPPRPGRIPLAALRHTPRDPRDCNVVCPTQLRLSLRAQAGNLSAATVLLQSDPQAPWQRHPLWPMGRHLGFERFSALLPVAGASVRYVFELTSGQTTRYYASNTLHATLQSAQADPYTCPMHATFAPPAWARDAVWYQIFPERFRNGDASNDPPRTQRWQAHWHATLPNESGRFALDVHNRRFGGDLQGIRSQLPYLRRLGVNALYLNPVFAARSLHKYDTCDHRHIDDSLAVKDSLAELGGESDDPATWQWSGSDRLFLDFIADAHQQGFRVILDGVFNHVGRGHWAFQDVLRHGRHSRYAEWFEITDWLAPIRYRAWDRPSGDLPLLRKDPALGLARGPREHILAIARRWLAPDGDPARGIDGFRLDVANDIPHSFWIDFRALVKAVKPEAFLCGEIWSTASAYLKGDQFDAAMNYPLAIAAHHFFVPEKKPMAPSVFATRLGELAGLYPFQAALAQQSLLDSHDTERLAFFFVNPEVPFDHSGRLHAKGHKFSLAAPTPLQLQRLRQALVLQMTFVGAPMIYYGDEAGMCSPDDPANRQPMLWPDLAPYDDPALCFNQELFAFYQRLIALRHHLPALRGGFFRPLLADDALGLLAFARDLAPHHVYILLNRSPAPRDVSLPVFKDDLLDYLDPASVELLPADLTHPTSRPTLRPAPHARRCGLPLRLLPYSSMVLARSP